MGVGESYVFCDVYGLDPELLAMLPQPVVSLLLLFPITDKSEEHTKTENEKIQSEGQVVSDKVYFMKQIVGNACGTVGILHSLANNAETLHLGDGYLKTFLEKTAGMSPMERAIFLGEFEVHYIVCMS